MGLEGVIALGPISSKIVLSASMPGLRYVMNVGDEATKDCSRRVTYDPEDSRTTLCDMLVHEMTHVWQYFHGEGVKKHSVWAQTLGAGYEYEPGDSWNSYNVEQQAHI